jgi:thioredoxin 1
MWQFLIKPTGFVLLLLATVIGCGSQPLPPPVDVSDADLDDPFAFEIQSVPIVLVKFGATWCGPCLRLDRELKDLSASLGLNAKIVTVDIDENRKLASTFGVGPIPHMILFKDGKAVDQKVGYHTATEVAQWMGVLPSSAGPGTVQGNPFVSAAGN